MNTEEELFLTTVQDIKRCRRDVSVWKKAPASIAGSTRHSREGEYKAQVRQSFHVILCTGGESIEGKHMEAFCISMQFCCMPKVNA